MRRSTRTVGQLDALRAAGAEKVYTDVLSGGWDDRPGVAQLRDHVRLGDVVTVVALDRLGCSLSGVMRTVQNQVILAGAAPGMRCGGCIVLSAVVARRLHSAVHMVVSTPRGRHV